MSEEKEKERPRHAALRCLKEKNMTIREIAEETKNSASTIRKAINALREFGYVHTVTYQKINGRHTAIYGFGKEKRESDAREVRISSSEQVILDNLKNKDMTARELIDATGFEKKYLYRRIYNLQHLNMLHTAYYVINRATPTPVFRYGDGDNVTRQQAADRGLIKFSKKEKTGELADFFERMKAFDSAIRQAVTFSMEAAC